MTSQLPTRLAPLKQALDTPVSEESGAKSANPLLNFGMFMLEKEATKDQQAQDEERRAAQLRRLRKTIHKFCEESVIGPLAEEYLGKETALFSILVEHFPNSLAAEQAAEKAANRANDRKKHGSQNQEPDSDSGSEDDPAETRRVERESKNSADHSEEVASKKHISKLREEVSLKDSIILSLHNELALLRQLQQLQVLPSSGTTDAQLANVSNASKLVNAPNTRLVLAKVRAHQLKHKPTAMRVQLLGRVETITVSLDLYSKDNLSLLHQMQKQLEDGPVRGIDAMGRDSTRTGSGAGVDMDVSGDWRDCCLDLAGNGLGSKGAGMLADLLKFNTTITYLNLENNSMGSQGMGLLADALIDNTSLLTLRLRANHLGSDGADFLAEAMEENRMLTEMDLSYNQLGSVGAYFLADGLKKNSTLTTLNLAHNDLLAEGAGVLAEVLKLREDGTSSNLTELELAYNNFDSGGVGLLADALKTNRSITRLGLRGNSVGGAGASLIADALKCNDIVARMDLACNELQETGMYLLCDGLKANRVLHTLNLDDNSLGALGTGHLAEVLTFNSTITWLELRGNCMSTEGAALLADALKHNTSVTRLNLMENSLGPVGASVLADALRRNNVLTEVDLRSNGLVSAGASLLADALKANSSLTRLDLRENNLGADDNKVIKIRVPKAESVDEETEPKKMIMYMIAVSTETRTWQVRKRYSELSAFHDSIKGRLPPGSRHTEGGSVAFPGKFTIGVEQRRDGLQAYFNALLKVLNNADAASSGAGRGSSTAAATATNPELQTVLEEFKFLLGVQTHAQAAREKATESFKSVAEVKKALSKGKQQEAKEMAEKTTQQAQEAMKQMHQTMHKTRKTSEHDVKRAAGTNRDREGQKSSAGKARKITFDILVNFLKKHDPTKIQRASDLLAAYSDSMLCQLLEDKYGQSPDVRSTRAMDVETPRMMTRQMLVQFYTKHDPGSVSRVDEILDAYSDEDLERKLSKKYGETPVALAKSHLQSTSSPALVSEKQEHPPRRLTKEMLVDFYQKHDPSSIPRIDAILAKYDDNRLMAAFRKKYGEIPTARSVPEDIEDI